MILILSDSRDITTSVVCGWLDRFEQNYLVISEQDEFEIKHLDDKDALIENTITGELIDFSKIKAYWFRRGGIKLKYNGTENDETDLISRNVKMEKQTCLDYLYFFS